MGNKRNFNTPIYHTSIEFIKNSRYSYILVEGINDKTIYETVYDKNWQITTPEVSRENSYNKSIKQSIINLIKDCNCINPYMKKRIGIVDRDYDFKENIENLFYTDKNDIESTAIQILTEEEAYDIFPKRLKINCAKYEFKYIYNTSKKIAQEFSNLWKNIHDYNYENSTIISYLINNYKGNEQALLAEIIKKNRNNGEYTIDYEKMLKIYKIKVVGDNQNYIKNMSLSTFESILVQNLPHFRGHDFFHILKYLISEETNISSIEMMNFEKEYISSSTQKDWIKKTKLYKDVKGTGAFK